MNEMVVSNPAGEAAKAEMQRVMTDPQHPLHGAYQRGDSAAVDKHINPFYEKAYGKGTVEIGGGLIFSSEKRQPAPQAEPDPSLSREDRVAQVEVESLLQRVLGDEYEPEMRYMGIGATHLFSIPDGKQVLDAFAPLIADLGPEAEVASVRFMAHLGRLLTARKGA